MQQWSLKTHLELNLTKEEKDKKESGERSLVEKDLVREHLIKLDKHRSTGLDGLSPWVLRDLAEVIFKLPSIIYERSWRVGEVPEDWRKVNITAVFRRGKKEELGNYRQAVSPLSLGRGWNSLFWMSSPSKWKKRRWSGVVNMDSLMENGAWPTWQPSMMSWMPR